MLLVIWGAAQVRSLVTGEGFDHHPVYVAMPITAAAWFFFGFFMEKGWGKAAFIASLVVIGVFIGLLVLGSSGDPCEDFKGDPYYYGACLREERADLYGGQLGRQ